MLACGQSMDQHLADFLRHLALERNASGYTVKSYREDLTQAIVQWSEILGERYTPGQVSNRTIRRYVAWLHEQGYSRSTTARRIAAVRSFFRYLCRQSIVTANPTQGIRSPKIEKKLPGFMSGSQVDSLLDSPLESDSYPLRDKAILEVFYAAGIRVGELCGLNLEDVRWDDGVIVVRGKGRKERLALLGRIAVTSLQEWLTERQELLAGKPAINALFLNKLGTRLTVRSVHRVVAKYLQRAGLDPKLSPHSLRHTFATHLVDAGAEIRSVQELLGHKNLTTTQIYTHLSTQKLQEHFLKAHPRAS
jgi:integrase/recombinase XerC